MVGNPVHVVEYIAAAQLCFTCSDEVRVKVSCSCCPSVLHTWNGSNPEGLFPSSLSLGAVGMVGFVDDGLRGL